MKKRNWSINTFVNRALVLSDFRVSGKEIILHSRYKHNHRMNCVVEPILISALGNLEENRPKDLIGYLVTL